MKKETRTVVYDDELWIEAAMQTGFSDQSHFTNYFNRFIGLAPALYRDIFLEKEKTPDE